MPRKVIIDCDMGIDDAVALSMLLFDQRLEVVGVTAVEGCVTAAQANNNLQAIVNELDPARYPRLGMASTADDAPAVDTRYLYGDDGLGNTNYEASSRQHAMSADKLIIDLVRTHPDDLTVVCLGPCTNLARALRRDPTIEGLIDQVVLTGGSLLGQGNITPCAEFNFYFDPLAARQVLKSRLATTLVPLEVTRPVSFGIDLLELLPAYATRAGFFLRQILPHAFRAYRQQLGHETITLNDAIGALAVIEPELFQCESLACDVEVEGELTRGMLVTDRRDPAEWRPNALVAVDLDPERAQQYVIDQLTVAGNSSRD